jgi:FtsH-binding integral membrane protein
VRLVPKLMSTPSTLLLCAGAAASLAGVWTLAGLSEKSTMRSTPRVLAAAAIGLLGEAFVYGRSPAELRAELALPLLFGLASVVALAVGAAKIEAALADKDGPRVVRRSAGIVAGTFFGMAAVGAASLDLSSGSLSQARLGWALMFALVASVLVVFAERARYAGVGLLALGKRSLLLGLVGPGLILGAQLTAAAQTLRAEEALRTQAPPVGAGPAAADAPLALAPAPEASAPLADAAASVAPLGSAWPGASAAPSGVGGSAAAAPSAVGEPGTVQVDAITARGMLEADVRGGVTRRLDKLQACLQDPNNQQKGSLSLKIGVDSSGSVTYSKATGGELSGTPLGSCLLAVFYKMGFASTSATNANFEITLHVP